MSICSQPFGGSVRDGGPDYKFATAEHRDRGGQADSIAAAALTNCFQSYFLSSCPLEPPSL